MKFCSTRGQVRDVSFKDAIIQGYAADGGMFLPQSIPQLDTGMKLAAYFSQRGLLEEWRTQKKTYLDVCKDVLALFVSEEIPRPELNDIVDRSFADFHKKNGEAVPIVPYSLCHHFSLTGQCWTQLMVYGDVSRSHWCFQGSPCGLFLLTHHRILPFRSWVTS